MYEPYYYHFCIHYYYHYYLSMNLSMKSPYFVKKQFRKKARLFTATHHGGAFTWCVWRRVAGWVAGGCWDYDITIVMKWIIPENSLSNTSKLQMGNQVARKCFEVGLNLWLVSDQGQAALNQCYSNDCKQPYRERLQTTLGTDPQTPGWFRIGFAYNFWRIHLGSRWHFRILYITNIFEQPGLSPKRW